MYFSRADRVSTIELGRASIRRYSPCQSQLVQSWNFWSANWTSYSFFNFQPQRGMIVLSVSFDFEKGNRVSNPGLKNASTWSISQQTTTCTNSALSKGILSTTSGFPDVFPPHTPTIVDKSCILRLFITLHQEKTIDVFLHPSLGSNNLDQY